MRLVILGAGGYGQTVADVARQSGRYDEILFLDDNSDIAVGRCADYMKFCGCSGKNRDIVESSDVDDCQQNCSDERAENDGRRSITGVDDRQQHRSDESGRQKEKYDAVTEFYPAFGNNEVRLEWLKRLLEEGFKVPILVHSAAYVSPAARLSEGTVVLPKAVVNTGCVIKKGCIINCGAVVDHGCVIEEGCHICLGAIVKAENRIPKCMKVEAGEVIALRQYPL